MLECWGCGACALSKVGHFLSRSKIAYVYNQFKSQCSNESMSDCDHLMTYLEQAQDVAYTVLWDACVPTINSNELCNNNHNCDTSYCFFTLLSDSNFPVDMIGLSQTT